MTHRDAGSLFGGSLLGAGLSGAGMAGGALMGAGLAGAGLRKLTARSMPSSHMELYHTIARMNPYEWEHMREAAAQIAGYQKSPMWPDFKPSPPRVDVHHYQAIMNTPGPNDAAQKLETEHVLGGDGFFNAIKHAFHTVVNGASAVHNWVSDALPHLRNAANFASHIPVIGEYAEAAQPILDTVQAGLDVSKPVVDAAQHFASGGRGQPAGGPS